MKEIAEIKQKKIARLNYARNIMGMIKFSKSFYNKWLSWTERITVVCHNDNPGNCIDFIDYMMSENNDEVYHHVITGWCDDISLIDKENPLLVPVKRELSPHSIFSEYNYDLASAVFSDCEAVLRLALMLSGGNDAGGVKLKAGLFEDIVGDSLSELVKNPEKTDRKKDILWTNCCVESGFIFSAGFSTLKKRRRYPV